MPVNKRQEKPDASGRRVYIIEIMPKWYDLVAPGLPSGKRCFYVGETGKDVSERFREHRTGGVKHGRRKKARARVFSRMANSNEGQALKKKEDLKLRRERMRSLPKQPDRESAEALEAATIDQLRREGHCVYPKGVGTVPFEEYRGPSAAK